MIVEAIGVSKMYRQRSLFQSPICVVDNVNLSIPLGSTVGLIGESGCGKSTLGRMLLGLIPCDTGLVKFAGEDLKKWLAEDNKKLRRSMQILFQHPDSSLNPRMKILDSLIEPLVLHRLMLASDAKDKVRELLDVVGLHPEIFSRYPHQLSGGQLQRVVLVRILTLEPKFIVLDEPTSMLDSSIQALVVESLQEVQKTFHLSYLFISHDLNLVRHVSDTMAVMKKGRIVESGTVSQIIEEPQHDYTKSLVQAFSYQD